MLSHWSNEMIHNSTNIHLTAQHANEQTIKHFGRLGSNLEHRAPIYVLYKKILLMASHRLYIQRIAY